MMSAYLEPMTLLFPVLLIGLVRVWRAHKDARRRLLWVAAPALLLYLLSTPPAGQYSLRALEGPYPQTEEVPAEAQAIVVLAGSIRDYGSAQLRPEPGPDTLYRCLRAAALHRKAPHLPVVLSGGPDEPDGPAYAEVMREFLVGQGVTTSRLVVEGRSRNTYENAVESCRLLRERGISRVVLVTDAAHMRRAVGCFRAQGVDVTPSACNHISSDYSFHPADVLPDARSLGRTDRAFHEWLGLLVYWARGRL